MNLLTSLLLWRGSGLSISSLDVNFLNAMSVSLLSVIVESCSTGLFLRATLARILRVTNHYERSITLLPPLRPVLAPAALPPINAQCVQRPADDVVTHAGKITHAPAAHEHDAVLL